MPGIRNVVVDDGVVVYHMLAKLKCHWLNREKQKPNVPLNGTMEIRIIFSLRERNSRVR